MDEDGDVDNDADSITGPERVLLLRHGQSEANATGDDVPDAPLTESGKLQAQSWRGKIGDLGADVVLISPLRRAVQTACLAFEGDTAPMELCRAAREMWWNERANHPGTPAQMRKLLTTLPRGDEVQEVDDALVEGPDEPADEYASVRQLEQILAMRPERTVAVVCHWGVINSLCGASPGNCDILECMLKQPGRTGRSNAQCLKVVKQHRPPAGPRTC